LPLPEAALVLINKADLFFMTASLSTNHRGGPKGFIRVLSNEPESVRLVYPEYSGNLLYQTLGNLSVKPLAGIIIPDFDTGDALYATCEAEILSGKDAAQLVPHTNLAVILTLKEARFVEKSLPFRAIDGEPSPYNPKVRALRVEKDIYLPVSKPLATATLVDRTMFSKDIARLKFKTDEPISYKIGQHVALDFELELGMGYSHMRDDDPQSLNDDLSRSFTITSTPPVLDKTTNEFELVVRKVGKVTSHLLKSNIKGGISCNVLGFDGKFSIDVTDSKVGFLAGGVGITPLLCQIQSLELENVQMFWTINEKDISFAERIMEEWNKLYKINLYISGAISEEGEKGLTCLKEKGVQITRRRLDKVDFENLADIEKWYVCAGPALKKSAEDWLKGKQIVSEEFNF
jgi:ferredoxin-NADP reductase